MGVLAIFSNSLHKALAKTISEKVSYWKVLLLLQFAERKLWNICLALTPGSPRFEPRELHCLGPLFRFARDELAEIGG